MTRVTALLKRLRAKGDEGSALILALIVTVAMGLLLSSALTFAGTGLTNTPHLRDQRNQLNYAQGTVDGAINNIRNSTISGTDLVPCPTYTPPVLAAGQDSGADGSTQFRATCTGLDSGNEPGDKAPIFAIQTLGPVAGSTAGTPNGINQTPGSNSVLSIDGGIFSNGRVWNKGSGQVDMVVEGSVLATGACTGNIHTTDPAGLQCSRAQTLGSDPQYAPAIASVAALSTLISTYGADPLPTCPSANSHVAWFSQGYYSELPSTLLTEASNQAGSLCSGTEAVYWFQPGFYYFDFTNASAGNAWNVNQVVGGTPLSTGPDWTHNGNLLPSDGTACDSSTNADSTPTMPGVQFIFGGNSTFNVGHQDIAELCGPDQAQNPGSPQSISLYGLNGNSNQGTSTPATVTDQERAATAAPTASPASGFQNPGKAQTIDTTNVSTATLGTNSSASLAYTTFQNVPAGVSNVSAKIRLNRTSTANLDKETLAIKFPGKATATQIDVPNTCGIALTSCDIAIPDSAWPNNYARWRQFNGASLTYTASTKNTAATDSVDGIELLASYTQPTLESLDIGNQYFTDAHDPQTSIFMHGTVYAPSVGIDVEGQNIGKVIFSRGVILWTLLVDSNPSFTQTAAPFQTPGVKGSRLVKFIGSVSTDGGSTWTDLVQACVKYNDNNSSGSPGPTLPGYTLTVRGWTVLRSSSQQAPTCA